MHHLRRCDWAVIMTLSVVFCWCPSMALSHLGSALRTGAEPKLLSHVRVSREPQYRGDSNEESYTLPISRIKSPSYQHRVLQFHSTGQTGPDYIHKPSKLIVSEYPAIKSLDPYPVPSKYGKLGVMNRLVQKYPPVETPLNPNDINTEDEDDTLTPEFFSVPNENGKLKLSLLPAPEDPTFTPYIGARALTDVRKFFQHLKENLNALMDDNEKGQDGQQQQQESLDSLPVNDGVPGSSSSSSEGNEEDNDDKSYSGTEDIEKIATPTRRGYSDPTAARSVYRHSAFRDGGDLTNRDSRSSSSAFILANRFNKVKPNDIPDEKTRELLHFMGYGAPEYIKANKYNPGWLFTNLGLGKRSEPKIVL